MSVSTTVWVGVWVVAFFNLRLGWTASALIVPGYLVPLLFVKPISVAVILLEAVITYLCVYFISEGPRPTGRRYLWCSFFGRDRFFLFIVISVLVRVIMDGWALPFLGERINEQWGLSLDYRSHLHSYGLIIVSLAANYFWKPGLARGFVALVAMIAATYIVVRFGLKGVTNFSIGHVQFMYADIASSLLASPKAYMILITTAYLASCMNLRYGWDSNGILVPALLALQWHAPWKIMASLAEAIVILIVAMLVLKLPVFRRMTIEGMRKTLLFFNIAFAYRMVLGFVAPIYFPDMKVTDLYGFGYLLSTLLAIKAYDRRVLVSLLRSTLQVSTAGAVLGSSLGFILLLMPRFAFNDQTPRQMDGFIADQTVASENLNDLIRQDRKQFYSSIVAESYRRPLDNELESFANGIQLLLEYRREREGQLLDRARLTLGHVNYDVYEIQDRFIYLRERAPANGWGIYVIDLENQDGLAIQVPAPLNEWTALDAGVLMFRYLDASSLAVAGSGRRTNADGAADVLVQPRSIFDAFHRLVFDANVLQIRGDSREIRKLTSNAWRKRLQLGQQYTTRFVAAGDAKTAAGKSGYFNSLEMDDPDSSSILWIKRALPKSFDLSTLKQLLPSYQIRWETSSLPNVLRESAWSGFAELTLSRHDCGALLAKQAKLAHGRSQNAVTVKESGDLSEWLLSQKAHILPRGSNQYQAPSSEDLFYFDQEIMRPLFRIRQMANTAEISEQVAAELDSVAAAAAIVGYQVIRFGDRASGHQAIILKEAESPTCRGWGTFVFRCGPVSQASLIEVPHPIGERHTFELGIHLFEKSKGTALLLAGAHVRANPDGSSDVNRTANKINLLNLVRQTWLRSLEHDRSVAIQVRGLASQLVGDAVVASSLGATNIEQLRPLTRDFIETYLPHLRLRYLDGTLDTAGYEPNGNWQTLAIRQPPRREFTTLWASPQLRARYVASSRSLIEHSDKLESLGIPIVDGRLVDWIQRREIHYTSCPPEIERLIQNHYSTGDPIALRKLVVEHSQFDWRVMRDMDSNQVFLLTGGTPQLPIVVRMSRVSSIGKITEITSPFSDSQRIREFAESSVTMLRLETRP